MDKEQDVTLLAEVSLYIAVRSKTGHSHTVNKTNVLIDGKYNKPEQMTNGYENQFSCRKGMLGIAEGIGEGTAGSDAAELFLHNLKQLQGEEGITTPQRGTELVRQALDKLRVPAGENLVNLGLLSVQGGRLTLYGVGEMPIYLLRRHSLRPLVQQGGQGEVFSGELELQDKDRLLICTKEVVDFVEPAMFQTILEGRGEPNQLAGDLVQEAMKNGAKRDVTVAVIICDAVQDMINSPAMTPLEENDEEEPAPEFTGPAWLQNKKVVQLTALVAVCVIAVVAVTLASVLKSRKTAPTDASVPQTGAVSNIITESGLPSTTAEEESTEPSTEEPATQERSTRERTTSSQETTRGRTTTEKTTKATETEPSRPKEPDSTASGEPTDNPNEDGTSPAEE